MDIHKSHTKEIYRLSREHYIENGKGITPSELKEKMPGYEDLELMGALGRMEGTYLISSWYKNEHDRGEMFYRPNTQSEWAALLEKAMGLDPDEIGFDPMIRDK